MSQPDIDIPPQNSDAEEAVLGALLLPAAHVIAEVADHVRPEDFYRESHGLIFRAALDLDSQGEPVDAITLAGELDKRGQLADVGGKFRIAELASLAPASANAVRYAQIVREQAVRRRLVTAGMNITQLGYGGIGDLDRILSDAETALNSAVSHTYHSEFSQLVEELPDFYKTVIEPGTQRWGAKSGFPDLDQLTTGMYAGQLIVIAARPTVGKSTLAQNVAENVADTNVPSAFFSLEMSKEELLIRSLSRICKLSSKDIRTNKLDADQREAIRQAYKPLSRRPFYIEDNATITVTELRARSRRLKRKHGLGLMVVDYLQLMVPEAQADKRNDQIATITRSLKLLAKELEIPVIALSQLNRNVESRENKRPTLADLRESGAIEQDADMVWFIYRPDLNEKDIEPAKSGEAEIIVAKNRMGESGTVRLLFIGRHSAFASPAKLPGVS